MRHEGVRWEGHTHREMHDMLHTDADPGRVVERGAQWDEISAELTEVVAEMDAVREKLGQCWTGEAATAASGLLGEHTERLTSLSRIAGGTGSHINTAGVQLQCARELMPKVPGFPEDAAFALGGVNPLTGVALGSLAGQAARAAWLEGEKQRAVEVMRGHESCSRDIGHMVANDENSRRARDWEVFAGGPGASDFPVELDPHADGLGAGGPTGVPPRGSGEGFAFDDAPVAPAGRGACEPVAGAVGGTTAVSSSAEADPRGHGAHPASAQQAAGQAGGPQAQAWQVGAGRGGARGGARPSGGAGAAQAAQPWSGAAPSVLGRGPGEARQGEARPVPPRAPGVGGPSLYGPLGQSPADGRGSEQEWRRKVPHEEGLFGVEGLLAAPRVIGE
ncbi:WXG100 family type VII secretion target [Actinosynnema mirum]|uniref:PPE domain-containing protein n=1 Tax=Actinosynnema mirum (strain ATCC 29888 / DSM 43827 / JCM 3225 / NBRC 14064 / NCIMB 13271 / NRRL B-12336 / IMRU 3971 / 101) TaxID=446462 RepID=C6WEL9_ACTMD|nr:hypothetical protein [Actinosynnema mirum]ACU37819.1 hypothetical protein Amir_3952 [Actinosynnema mirum DSM 43827]